MRYYFMVRNNRLRAVVIVIAVLLVAYIGGLRVSHPQEGVGTSLGGAKTSLVIYRAGDALAFKNKIIFKSNTGHTALGVVAGTNGSTAYVNVGDRFEQVNQPQVHGKLLAVIPFLGVIFGVFGL
jgi:hypothetical protein